MPTAPGSMDDVWGTGLASVAEFALRRERKRMERLAGLLAKLAAAPAEPASHPPDMQHTIDAFLAAVQHLDARLARWRELGKVAHRISLICGQIAHEWKNATLSFGGYLDELAPDSNASTQERLLAMQGLTRLYTRMCQQLDSWGERFREVQAPQRAVDLGPLVKEACSMVLENPSCACRRLSVKGDKRAWTKGCEVALATAISNVVLNASRAARQEVIVRLHAGAELAVITVLDDGPGFEPNAQHHDVERDEFPHAKGLAIVTDILAWHGGHVAFNNRPDGGGCVMLSLPTLNYGAS